MNKHEMIGITNATITGGDVDGNRVFVNMDERPSTHLWTTGKRCYIATEGPAAVEQDGKWSIDLQPRLMAAAQDCDDDDVRDLLGEAACALAMLTGRPA